MTRDTADRWSASLVMAAASRDVRVFVALGSNLNDPVQQILSALDALKRIPATRVLTSSSLYRSRPMGGIDQPDFVNAVAELATRLPALNLLEQLQRIERDHGRVRDAPRRGPRTLDLDLLLYGDETIRTPQLEVPHPGIAERDFVLYPLCEIAPHLEIIGHGAVTALLAHCRRHGLQCIGRPEDVPHRLPADARVVEQ